MDMSLVMAAMAAQSGSLQTQVATSVIKSNIDAERSNVLTLLGAGQQGAPSLGNVGAGIGGTVNLSV